MPSFECEYPSPSGAIVMTTAVDFVRGVKRMAEERATAAEAAAPCDCPLCAMWEAEGEGPGPFVNRITGWKLFRMRKDRSLGPLFINRRQWIKQGVWLPAEDHRTKGYAHRPGWHACLKPEAPHLRLGEDRVWCLVELADYVKVDRPVLQGGTWVLAQWLRVVKVCPMLGTAVAS